MAGRVAAVIEENEGLQARLEEMGDIDEEDWQDMREHVALLMEENKLLLSQKQEQAVRADRLEATQTAAERCVARLQADPHTHTTKWAVSIQFLDNTAF